MKSDRTFWQQTIDYALADAYWCHRLWEDYGVGMPAEERWQSWHTSMMGDRGVQLNSDFLVESIQWLGRKEMELMPYLPWIANGEEDNVFSQRGFEQACRDYGVPKPRTMAKDDEYFQWWLETHADSAPFVKPYRELASVHRGLGVLQRMRRASIDGRMAYQMKYFGAHTGRWSGDAGLNMQNFPRDAVAGIHLRNMIVPAPGKTFISCDFSQIEARVLLWLAGDYEQLQMMTGTDAYEAHARATMGYRDPRPLADVDPGLRQLAKARVLACGYGVGAAKFRVMAWSLARLKLNPDECKETVRAYRESNPYVADWNSGLWGRLQLAFRRSAGDGWFRMALPSGRNLDYRDLQVSGNGNKVEMTATVQGRTSWFYGGKLTENLVQAVARDLLADAVRALEAAGVHVVLHVHDEVLCEVDRGTDPREVQRIMENSSPWAVALPLQADAFEIPYYQKG